MMEPTPSQLKPRLLVAAVIFVLGTLLFIPFLLSGPDTLIYAQDQLRGIGSWQLYAEYLRKGILPVWWGSQLGGSPVYEAMPGEGVYPFSVLSMLVVSGAKRVGLLIWLHTLLSGGSAYLLGRDVKQPLGGRCEFRRRDSIETNPGAPIVQFFKQRAQGERFLRVDMLVRF